MTGVIRQGTLGIKKKGSIENRWFVLRPGYLDYYASEADLANRAPSRGRLQLDEVESFEVTKGEFFFQTIKRNFTVIPEESERLAWARDFKSAIAGARASASAARVEERNAARQSHSPRRRQAEGDHQQQHQNDEPEDGSGTSSPRREHLRSPRRSREQVDARSPPTSPRGRPNKDSPSQASPPTGGPASPRDRERDQNRHQHRDQDGARHHHQSRDRDPDSNQLPSPRGPPKANSPPSPSTSCPASAPASAATASAGPAASATAASAATGSSSPREHRESKRGARSPRGPTNEGTEKRRDSKEEPPPEPSQYKSYAARTATASSSSNNSRKSKSPGSDAPTFGHSGEEARSRAREGKPAKDAKATFVSPPEEPPKASSPPEKKSRSDGRKNRSSPTMEDIEAAGDELDMAVSEHMAESSPSPEVEASETVHDEPKDSPVDLEATVEIEEVEEEDEEDDEGTLLEKGVLTVMKSSGPARRYFVLTDMSLSYYECEENYELGKEPRGRIHLEDIVSVAVEDSSFFLTLCDQDLPFEFRVPSSLHMDAWAEAFKTATTVTEETVYVDRRPPKKPTPAISPSTSSTAAGATAKPPASSADNKHSSNSNTDGSGSFHPPASPPSAPHNVGSAHHHHHPPPGTASTASSAFTTSSSIASTAASSSITPGILGVGSGPAYGSTKGGQLAAREQAKHAMSSPEAGSDRRPPSNKLIPASPPSSPPGSPESEDRMASLRGRNGQLAMGCVGKVLIPESPSPSPQQSPRVHTSPLSQGRHAGPSSLCHGYFQLETGSRSERRFFQLFSDRLEHVSVPHGSSPVGKPRCVPIGDIEDVEVTDSGFLFGLTSGGVLVLHGPEYEVPGNCSLETWGEMLERVCSGEETAEAPTPTPPPAPAPPQAPAQATTQQQPIKQQPPQRSQLPANRSAPPIVWSQANQAVPGQAQQKQQQQQQQQQQQHYQDDEEGEYECPPYFASPKQQPRQVGQRNPMSQSQQRQPRQQSPGWSAPGACTAPASPRVPQGTAAQATNNNGGISGSQAAAAHGSSSSSFNSSSGLHGQRQQQHHGFPAPVEFSQPPSLGSGHIVVKDSPQPHSPQTPQYSEASHTGSVREDDANDARLWEVFERCDEAGIGQVHREDVARACKASALIAEFFGVSKEQLMDEELQYLDNFFRTEDGTEVDSLGWEEFKVAYQRRQQQLQNIIVHRGSLLVLRGTASQVQYFVVYQDRFEYFSDLRSASKGINCKGRFWVRDVKNFRWTDAGFRFQLQHSTLDLRVMAGDKKEEWSEAVRPFAEFADRSRSNAPTLTPRARPGIGAPMNSMNRARSREQRSNSISGGSSIAVSSCFTPRGGNRVPILDGDNGAGLERDKFFSDRAKSLGGRDFRVNTHSDGRQASVLLHGSGYGQQLSYAKHTGVDGIESTISGKINERVASTSPRNLGLSEKITGATRSFTPKSTKTAVPWVKVNHLTTSGEPDQSGIGTLRKESREPASKIGCESAPVMRMRKDASTVPKIGSAEMAARSRGTEAPISPRIPDGPAGRAALGLFNGSCPNTERIQPTGPPW